MKKVAIYGFAPQTRDLIKQSDAEEVWSLNNAFAYGLPVERMTRTFEMHEIWQQMIARDRSDSGVVYWKWLLAPHDFPFYMHMVEEDFRKALDELNELEVEEDNERLFAHIEEQKKIAQLSIEYFQETEATIIKYPMEEIMDNLFPKLDGINTEIFPERGLKKYFTSSMDYMIALAIHEEFDQIEFYGIELKEKTEWAMQKPSMEYWVGLAKGRGIRMLVPTKSLLCNAPLYGLGEAQMIAVQVPEALRRKYVEKMDYWRNMFNHLAGQHTSLLELGDEENATKAMKMIPDIEVAKSKIFMYEGAANAMTHMIDNENMDIGTLSMKTVTKFEAVDDRMVKEAEQAKAAEEEKKLKAEVDKGFEVELKKGLKDAMKDG